jgi:IclR family KDG regulon transcriptional repressor
VENQKLTVRAVERALDILLCFTSDIDLSLTDIAGRVALHKSTVHRLLASLEGKGFVIRDPQTEKYRLGFRVWELSANLSRTDDPAQVLLPEMERLGDELGETVSLYIRDGEERIRIQAVQSKQAIRRVAPVGVRLPLYVGASSKVLLAYADLEEVRADIMNNPEWSILMDRDAFLDQLLEIRQKGFATSIEEREPGAAAVAAPIFGMSGKLTAALSVSGPANRLTLEKMISYSPLVIQAAERMGKMVR